MPNGGKGRWVISKGHVNPLCTKEEKGQATLTEGDEPKETWNPHTVTVKNPFSAGQTPLTPSTRAKVSQSHSFLLTTVPSQQKKDFSQIGREHV